jgi:hypothetical protein
MTDELRKAADAILVSNMHPGLKAAIDDAIANGRPERDILRLIKRKAKGRGLVVLAVEAYLGCDQEGRLPRA